MDEARHNEGLHRDLAERLEGRLDPIAANTKEILDTLISDSR